MDLLMATTKKAALKWDTHPKGEVPEEYYSIPLGEASIEREGSQLTVLCYGTMVHVCGKLQN